MVQLGYVAVLLFIFLLVFNNYQRLYMFSLMTLLILALSLFLLLRWLIVNK